MKSIEHQILYKFYKLWEILQKVSFFTEILSYHVKQ